MWNWEIKFILVMLVLSVEPSDPDYLSASRLNPTTCPHRNLFIISSLFPSVLPPVRGFKKFRKICKLLHFRLYFLSDTKYAATHVQECVFAETATVPDWYERQLDNLQTRQTKPGSRWFKVQALTQFSAVITSELEIHMFCTHRLREQWLWVTIFNPFRDLKGQIERADAWEQRNQPLDLWNHNAISSKLL